MSPQNIKLRKIDYADWQFILKLTTDKDWLINIGERGVSDRESAKRYIDNSLLSNYQTEGLGLMGIEVSDTGRLAGLCGLLQRDYFEFPDLGFALLPEYRGQGLVKSAAKQTLLNPLAQRSKLILATTKPTNTASIKTLKKLGFRLIGNVSIAAQPSCLLVKV